MARDWLPTNQGDDFTVIGKAGNEGIQHLIRERRLAPDLKGSTTVCFAGEEEARVQACWCYERSAISITVRTTKSFLDARRVSLHGMDVEAYQLDSKYKAKAGTPPLPVLNSQEEICRVVYQALQWDSKRPQHGFLVVAGSTKSLKSVLARGLIHKHLELCMKQWLCGPSKQRRPHLVTCEDDIEKLFFPRADLTMAVEKAYPENEKFPCASGLWLTNTDKPDYTPRKLGTSQDVATIEQAVDDALRMTPSVFYAGEIRKRVDWPHLYRLAQSHLVVLTMHASSLVNTFEIMQDRLRARTATQRSELASTTFGVIHMRAGGDLGQEGKTVSCILPSCWRRTGKSIGAFTSNGLASIVPAYTKDADHLPECLGRRYFADCLLAEAKQAESQKDKDKRHDRVAAAEQGQTLLHLATAWDLAGD